MRARAPVVTLAVAGFLLLVSAVALARVRTSTRIYEAFTSGGKPAIHVTKTVEGQCFAGSIEADRNDAWRCLSANVLYDPCFSWRKAKRIVLCPAAAWKRSGVEIKLTKPFPPANKEGPSTGGMPWAMQTFSGLTCTLQGMGPFINKKTIGDYACTQGEWLWDKPSRKTEPWTIYVAPAGATELTTKTKIELAWF